MAEAVVSFLIDNLYSLLETEVREMGGIEDAIVDVRDELERMKAFLRDADSMEDEDEGIRVWVKQVRELAYEAEDVIDEFLLSFEHPRELGTRGRLSKISRVIKTLKARRRVASELRRIKSRAVSISEGRQRYNCNWSSTERGPSLSAENYVQSLSQRRNDARLLPEARLVGIERPKEELVSWILEDTEERRNVKVLAVKGMGGLGKTTLVSQVYRDANIKQQFHHRAWITVSQAANIRKILVDMNKQLFKGIEQAVPEETDSKDIHSLKEDIHSFLRDNKYLIVLDDVWTKEAWDSLIYAFPENDLGSCLIVTTRIGNVANIATTDVFGGFVYPLTPLNPDESWNIFCARVFKGQPCPNHLVEDSQVILERCRGLPLAIVSIGALLASRQASREEWQKVRRNLGKSNNQLSDMEKILLLSFDDLRYELKSCLLWLSMFPEDYMYNKSYLVQIWIGESFIQQMGDLTQEEVGELYFNELIDRNLIQVAEEVDPREDENWFRVHDIVHEILLRKSMNHNFATITSKQSLRVPEGVRRLFIGTTLEKLEGDHKLSRLRSLHFIPSKGTVKSSISMSKFLTNRRVRFLKVLDCGQLPLDTFPKFITTQYNLRYLSLSHTKVSSIPRSIGRLRKLETLDLEGTLIEELPAEILQLCGLRHLMVCHTTSENTNIGVRVPRGMGTLTSLHTLSLIQVSRGSSELIRSLGKLKQLRDLSIQQLGEESWPILCSSIEQMSQLRRLQMESRGEDEILDVQHISSPPPYLQELLMYGRLMRLPSWVTKLQSLTVLILRWSKLMVDPLESLQALPNLLLLRFSDKAYDGRKLSFRARGFQMLKTLWFEKLGRLRRVTVEEGALPRLQDLVFRECKLLEEVPSGIEYLTSLNKLEFTEMGEQFVTKLRSSSDDSDFERIKHVPSLFVGTWNADGSLEPYTL